MATILRGRRVANAGVDESTHPATYTFSDMASQGDDYVRRIRGEALHVVEQAKAEADRVRAQAEAEGRAAAEADIDKRINERLAAELKTLRPALDGVVAELQASRGEWLAHWREAAIRLAAAMAERIVRRELAEDPTISQEWLGEALTLAAGASEVTVRLAPGDFDNLRGHAESLAESVAGLAEARFVADEAITPGGCRVETRHGSIDQQLQTQLDRLAEELS